VVDIRHRLHVIRRRQVFAGAIIHDFSKIGQGLFVASLFCYISSLAICVHENKLSIDGIEVEFKRGNGPTS